MDQSLLTKIKTALQTVFGDRLEGVVLYGSEAEKAATEESDIDLLVLLRGPVDSADDLAALDALYPLVLESERPIHAICVSAEAYEAAEYPLYRNARETGIAI